MKASIIVGFVIPLGSRLASNARPVATTTFLSRAAAIIMSAPASSLSSSSSTCLHMGVEKLADYTGAALQFFTSVRTPAALIAGASLSSLFSLVNLVNDIGDDDNKEEEEGGKKKKYSQLTVILARIYHGLCLTSLILSLNVIVTATAAATTLLLENHNGMAYNAYAFLNRELRYEFITTRWSFLTCLLSFITSIAARSLLEFDLLRKGRRRLALVVVFSMSALLAHLLSYVNSTLYNWPNMAVMTLDVIQTIVRNALNRTEKRPLELLSLVFGAAALFVAAPLLRFENKKQNKQER